MQAVAGYRCERLENCAIAGPSAQVTTLDRQSKRLSAATAMFFEFPSVQDRRDQDSKRSRCKAIEEAKLHKLDRPLQQMSLAIVKAAMTVPQQHIREVLQLANTCKYNKSLYFYRTE
jgi:hypothetical protein